MSRGETLRKALPGHDELVCGTHADSLGYVPHQPWMTPELPYQDVVGSLI